MPWDARDTMSLRTEFVLFASQDGANIRSLCRHFGISPATGYKWLRRWGRKVPPAFRTARAYRTIPRTAHLTTSLPCCVWPMTAMNAGAHAR